MLFWMACEELKTELQNPEIVEEKARLIYEDYISILSPKEVSSYFILDETFVLPTYFNWFLLFNHR